MAHFPRFPGTEKSVIDKEVIRFLNDLLGQEGNEGRLGFGNPIPSPTGKRSYEIKPHPPTSIKVVVHTKTGHQDFYLKINPTYYEALKAFVEGYKPPK
ncbi:MAG: hypothetical protein KJ709_02640 [Nanoarchaeota archaeon]|nr:hypothetical protein [Nanoarchaeota archaeon]